MYTARDVMSRELLSEQNLSETSLNRMNAPCCSHTSNNTKTKQNKQNKPK
jgi:hypothetical protein